jgi:phosphatidylglycerophosphatase B
VNAPVNTVMRRLSCVLAPAAALLALTHLIPFLPRLDLAGPVALAAYWVAESGGTHGIPLIGLVMTALLVSRTGITRWRAAEAPLVVLALAAVLGGGAYANEHLVKPTFAVPRPNVVELAESPALQSSVEDFYALPDKSARSDHLRKVLTPEVKMHDRVRDHWIAETGYSFPSGHSFAAMTFATFFLALGLSCCSGWRLGVCCLLVAWAVAVCYSRPLLRVHSPTDVCVGALQGVVAGVTAFLIVRLALRGKRLTAAEPATIMPTPGPSPAQEGAK